MTATSVTAGICQSQSSGLWATYATRAATGPATPRPDASAPSGGDRDPPEERAQQRDSDDAQLGQGLELQ